MCKLSFIATCNINFAVSHLEARKLIVHHSTASAEVLKTCDPLISSVFSTETGVTAPATHTESTTER